MTLTWLLLIAAVALLVIGALRWDLLVARWRELATPRPGTPQAPSAVDHRADHAGLHPHAAPVHKPALRRSGRRH
ncbi:MAG: hypothetical protein EKK53_25640 [Burkholderiales bacterium]|nr:MAG: hypothetical protein EKK53_25640 [Burkholderiales bacterium]